MVDTVNRLESYFDHERNHKQIINELKMYEWNAFILQYWVYTNIYTVHKESQGSRNIK